VSDALGLTDPVDFKSEVPVYEQIRRRIQAAIGSGAFAPDDPLPSVRSLARSLMVNPNTVMRVYRELELAGVVWSRQGRGVFVTGAARGQCREDGCELVRARMREAIELAHRAGIPARELARLWNEVREERGGTA